MTKKEFEAFLKQTKELVSRMTPGPYTLCIAEDIEGHIAHTKDEMKTVVNGIIDKTFQSGDQVDTLFFIQGISQIDNQPVMTCLTGNGPTSEINMRGFYALKMIFPELLKRLPGEGE